MQSDAIPRDANSGSAPRSRPVRGSWPRLLALALLIGLATTLTSAQARILENPPSGTVAVASYDDIAAVYTLAEQIGLEAGRSATDDLFGDDPSGLIDRLSPELRQFVDAQTLQMLRPQFERDILHFEVPAARLSADIHVEYGAMQGFLNAGSILGLDATLTQGSAGSHVASGRWEGTVSAGSQLYDLTLIIDLDGASPYGTLSIPVLGLQNAPLEALSFAAEQAIGERADDAALPNQPGGASYWARYPWGDQHLAVQMQFDAEGTITMLSVVPEPLVTPDPRVNTPLTLQVPFSGVWWVFWGGTDALHNYHVVAPQQRHALDIMIWKDGGTFTGDGLANEDYWAWGQPIFAPMDAQVVEVLDGIDDNTPGVLNTADHPAGNHVVLQTADEVFVYIAHLQKGSVQVAVGDVVTTGELLGLTGNSGNSSEPHLHLHAQTRLDMFDPAAVGIPILFRNLLIDGRPFAETAAWQGNLISPAEPNYADSRLIEFSDTLSEMGISLLHASAPAQLGALGARLFS